MRRSAVWRWRAALASVLVSLLTGCGDEAPEPLDFTARPNVIRQPESDVYSFSVVGHPRRWRGETLQIQRTLLDSLPEIDKRDLALVMTGDICFDPGRRSFLQIELLLRERLTIPVFIAPGNHEMGGTAQHRRDFETLFGPTYGAHSIGNSLFIILNTEDEDGLLSQEQLTWLLEQLASPPPSADHVFLFMHRVLWLVGHDRYAPLIPAANGSTRVLADRDGNGVFWQEIFPALATLGKEKKVTLFAGDVGSNIPLVVDQVDDVTLIASGNRHYGEEDGFWWNHYLRVFVNGADLDVKVVPLRGAELRLEEFHVDRLLEKARSKRGRAR